MNNTHLRQLIHILTLLISTLISCQLAAAEPDFWWYRFPTYSDVSLFSEVPARVVQGNFGADFTWGQYAQRLSLRSSKSQINQAKSINPQVKVMSYVEGLGQPRLYVAGFVTNNGIFTRYSNENDLVEMKNNAWSWTQSGLTGVNFRAWIGPHNSVNNDEFTKPACTQSALGLPEPTYPDGTPATGYSTQGVYPLNAKFFDATIVKDINDSIPRDYEQIIDVSANYQLLRPMLYKAVVGEYFMKQLPGKVVGDTIFAGNIKLSKDPACPYWYEYHRIAARTMLRNGDIDGIWTDNCSPWDNFSGPHKLFGAWSEYNFNLYLKEKYSTQELSNMGISNINTFNIRTYLKQKAGALGASTSQKNDPNAAIYLNPAWYTDKVWNAYKVFKQKTGADFLKNHYTVFKEEALKAGKPDFAVGGNDVPMLNTGWVRDDYMDIVCTELRMDDSQTISYQGGMGRPPLGKYAPIFRAALEHQKGPYSMVWFYGPDKTNSPDGLSKVLISEAFANHTFIKSADNTCATPSAHRWLNAFVEREEHNFGRRYNYADIGILFSATNYYAMALPGSIIPDKNYQTHRQDYLGFATAMIDAHLPYRVITDWKLNAATLSNFKTFIMPCADYLNDSTLNTLTSWVEEGGRLVLTGSPGKFFDSDGLFQRRSVPLLQNLVGRNITNAPEIVKNDALIYDKTVYTRSFGKGTVVWTAEPTGMNYFNAKYMNDAVSRRTVILQNIKNMISPSGIFDGSELPVLVGANLWHSFDKNIIFVDLVNYNYNEMSDQIQDFQNLVVKCQLKPGVQINSVTGMSPDGNTILNYTVKDGWITVTVPLLQNYLSVKVMTSDITSIQHTGAATNEVTIQPNPAKSTLKIQSNGSTISRLEMYDCAGRICSGIQLNDAGLVDISNLQAGLYTLRIQVANETVHTKKIIIKNE
ncbi:MAG: T9SS type A sorting domain-containing protein [Paludibacter sp.]|jgi:hypothetical protein|nr:T9SS type A sorting domain-containing protein [Paludibacter sp.]